MRLEIHRQDAKVEDRHNVFRGDAVDGTSGRNANSAIYIHG